LAVWAIPLEVLEKSKKVCFEDEIEEEYLEIYGTAVVWTK